MFLDFFYELRAQKLEVGLQEWLALMEGLSRGLHGSSFTGFYNLARSLLIHSEADFDAFDQAFAKCFEGIELEALDLTNQLESWLSDPARLEFLSEEDRLALQALDLEELRRQFQDRLREQRDRHQGGNRWVGTGGTSPFGAFGINPAGIRVGDTGGGRSAAQVAALRRFRSYRSDLVLDVRQIRVALKRLRELRRDGRQDELDLDQTIKKTGDNAGDLELVWRAPRRNNVKVLLLMDVGGSMDPHARVVSQLFSAANQSKQFRDFKAFYFHNCVYDKVYRDAWFRDPMPLSELFGSYGKNYRLILVGDAMMHPMELLDSGGIIDFWYHNYTPGIEWMRKLSSHFERSAWLNPEPPRFWNHETVNAIRQLFSMFPLTLDGLQDAVQHLTQARRAA